MRVYTSEDWRPARDWNEVLRRDREEVGREIRRLIAVSGITQRDFAVLIGTSPSRLSSYSRGLVSPSAALMLRIQRVSRILEAERVRIRNNKQIALRGVAS